MGSGLFTSETSISFEEINLTNLAKLLCTQNVLLYKLGQLKLIFGQDRKVDLD